jgi:hypothetical protein
MFVENIFKNHNIDPWPRQVTRQTVGVVSGFGLAGNGNGLLLDHERCRRTSGYSFFIINSTLGVNFVPQE